MRAGTADGPLGSLEPAVRSVERAFLEAIKRHTATTTRKVMLGDATVTEQETFDADAVGRMFGSVTARLAGWRARDVTVTNNEDIRRVFVKFEAREGGYVMTGHFSLQFHVLLYYMPDQRVVDCQKRLSEVIDLAKSGEERLAEDSDALVFDGVRAPGETEISEMELFERLYRDDSLVERLEARLEGAASEELRRLSAEKRRLFDELDGLLTETYQTVPIMIDDARLVTGEEGCLCTFDVERKQGGSRGQLPGEVDAEVLAAMDGRLREVRRALEPYGGRDAPPAP